MSVGNEGSLKLHHFMVPKQTHTFSLEFATAPAVCCVFPLSWNHQKSDSMVLINTRSHRYHPAVICRSLGNMLLLRSASVVSVLLAGSTPSGLHMLSEASDGNLVFSFSGVVSVHPFGY